jgi:hypothetical protein
VADFIGCTDRSADVERQVVTQEWAFGASHHISILGAVFGTLSK